MSLYWTVHSCIVPIVYQGVWISVPLLSSALLIRLCVAWGKIHPDIINGLVSILGLFILVVFYKAGILYFVFLCLLNYGVLHFFKLHRGAVVAIVSVLYLLVCEGVLASAVTWHQLRGSFLVMVMKAVSLGFDLDVMKDRKGVKLPPKIPRVPDFVSYTCYCFFPSVIVFGPFMTYTEHYKFLSKSSLSRSWMFNIFRTWVSGLVCLSISVCLMPLLFPEPTWNKWLSAYSAAASFRYSHYFVSFFSESALLASGMGYQTQAQGDITWSDFPVVRPLFIELPRSLGTVVTNWNLPMHLFLKSYVFKPSVSYLGPLGALLCTYAASATLHGLNFQLAAVLLSIGVYAYIENVLRYKLSVQFNACVMDRPCNPGCKHQQKKGTALVFIVNSFFTCLAMFHLAYLGLMFSSESQSEDLEQQGYSMLHTLRKWAQLDFLSHWIAGGSYIIYLLL